MTQEKYEQLAKEVIELRKSNNELLDRYGLLGKQIAKIKEDYKQLEIEVRILREGGNL